MSIPESSPVRALIYIYAIYSSSRTFNVLFVCLVSTIEAFPMCCFICLLFVHQNLFHVPFISPSRPFRCAVCVCLLSFIEAFSMCSVCAFCLSSRPFRCALCVPCYQDLFIGTRCPPPESFLMCLLPIDTPCSSICSSR